MKSDMIHIKLKDILAFIVDNRGKTPPLSDGGYRLLEVNAVSALKKFPVYDDVRKYVDFQTYSTWFRKGHPQIGDILIPTVGTLGAVSFVNSSDCCIAQNLIAIRPDQSVCDSHYLYYYLSNPLTRKRLLNLDIGGVQPSIKVPHIMGLDIDLPPLNKQRKCAAILRALDDKIELNQEINENLEQQMQAIFQEWFIDNPSSAEWPVGTFSDLIERTASGDWGKEAPCGNHTEAVYCIRGADIPDVRAGSKGKMPTRYILPKNYAAKRLADGDIVVEISGGSPTQSTGRAAAISTALLNRYDKGMVCTNFCKALKPIRGYSTYVFHYWQHLYDAGVFFLYENGTTGIKNLDISSFLETEPIVVAPAALIERFDALCRPIFANIYANGLENEKLTSVRDTLLPGLLSGEIDVSDIQI